jgi:hypothetical protein
LNKRRTKKAITLNEYFCKTSKELKKSLKWYKSFYGKKRAEIIFSKVKKVRDIIFCKVMGYGGLRKSIKMITIRNGNVIYRRKVYGN